MNYDVRIINSRGKKIKKMVTADNERMLQEIIQREGSFLLKFEPVEELMVNRGKFDIKLASIFCYQLSTMLSAGVDLPQSLNLIQSKTKNPKEKKVYRSLLESVQKGNSLSNAMHEQKNVFDDLLISMVESGELSGDLEGSLTTMSKHYDKNKKIQDKMKAATIYPVVLSVVSMVIVLILVVFVLPSITAGFSVDELPFTTKALYKISNLILGYWWLILLILSGIFIGLKTLYDTPRIKIKIHQKILYIPVLGDLLRTIYSARLARSFASLYSQGVSIIEMIDLSSKTLNNAYFERRLQELLVVVSHGSSISAALDDIEEFNPMLSSMMNIGEETGSLDRVLSKIADYFDGEADAAITRLLGLMEPIMIVIMGIVIAFIVLSIMQPMFKMYDTI